MKYLKPLLILSLLIIVTACKKDDDGNSEFSLTAANFAGTYRVSSFNEVTEDTDIDNGLETNTTTTLVGDSFQGTYVFNADGTFVMNAQYNITETVVVENNPPVVDEYMITDDFSGTYTVNTSNETLTITYTFNGFEDTSTYTIQSFSETQVTLTYIDINDNPANGNTYEINGEINLVRQ